MPLVERYGESFPDDVASALRHYDGISVDLGNRFRASLDNVIDAILARPTSFGYAHQPFRAAMLDTFPYVVLFVVTDTTILFTGVVHSASNPDEWFDRPVL